MISFTKEKTMHLKGLGLHMIMKQALYPVNI